MSQPPSSSPTSRSAEQPALAPTVEGVPLRPLHRRLARYLYVGSMVGGRRVLDIGSGDGQGAAYLVERGASSVFGIDIASQPSPERTASRHVTVRAMPLGELLRPDGLRAAVGGTTFDIIFLHATPELCTQPFLAEVRRLLGRGGHVIVAARSKETFTSDASAIGYFDLLDSLTAAGVGPVAMLGQSPFLGATLVPFGATDPQLVFDDTLSPPEHPDEYVALCGAPRVGGLPYQVVKLPKQALFHKPALAEKIVERVEVSVADPQLVAERDRLKARVDGLTSELAQRAAAAQVQQAAQRGLEDRLRSIESDGGAQRSELRGLQEKLESTSTALRAAEAQRKELEERLRQRDRSDSESVQAALLHERQMRELRGALEERDAFVAELEDQARELPRLEQKLQRALMQAEDGLRSERHFRQRLAEAEGQLLRIRGEQQAREQQLNQGPELEQRSRDLEAMRTELLVGRVELEQAQQQLADKQAAAEQALQAIAKERAEHDRLRPLVAQHERSIAERDAALAEVRRELVLAQERLQQQHAELEQRTRSYNDVSAQLARSRIEQTTPLLASPSGRTAERDGIPLQVGDLPTAPVPALGVGADDEQPTLAHELNQLRQRLADLLTENGRLKDKLTEAERETWKHLKARSEAEQAAAEVREDTVRKLRDARKLASVELTRAMEDATKKAVQLREELARTETERKEAQSQLKELRGGRDTALELAASLKQELDTLRWSASLPDSSGNLHPSPVDTAAVAAAAAEAASREGLRALAEERTARQVAQQRADEAQSRVAELRSAVVALEQSLAEARERAQREQQRVEVLEEDLRQSGGGQQVSGLGELLQLQQELQQQGRSLLERTAERDALSRLLAEVEREAAARAERTRAMRVRLAEREREAEALRAELHDRERKIAALESHSSTDDELARLESELHSTRRRISELMDETSRTEHHNDDAVATALRERARAVRMTESLEQTARERDDARLRSGDLEQRLSEAQANSERLRAELLRLSSSASYPSAASANAVYGGASSSSAPASSPPAPSGSSDPRDPRGGY